MDSQLDINHSLSNLVEKVRPSLVRIHSKSRGFGAGTIWLAEGLIVTNAHVIAGNRVRVLMADGSENDADVLAVSRKLDLAALMVDRRDLRAIEIGSSSEMKAGSIVVAMGFPWGASDGATMGVLIGMNQAWSPGSNRARELMAASLHLRPGHSGGPMVNAAGQLIGINTMMNGPNVGVAIPVDEARRWLQKTLHKHPSRLALA